MLAFIEKPACVGRHGFGGGRLAMRARNRGNSLHQAPPSARISGCSIKLHKADRTIIAVAISNVSRSVLPRAGFSQPSAPQLHTLRKWRNHPKATIRKAATVSGKWRSEEHTSELPSLMRISYAVFCLKKNNN